MVEGCLLLLPVLGPAKQLRSFAANGMNTTYLDEAL